MKKIFSHGVFLSLVTVLSACSGSKTETSENENVNDASASNLVTPGFGTSSFRDWYQNGYVLTGITTDRISTGSTQQYLFELNTTDNTITNNSNTSAYPDFVYEDSGNVVTIRDVVFPDNDYEITYHNNGSIASYVNEGSNGYTETTQFLYENSRLVRQTTTGRDDTEVVKRDINYNYSADGIILSSQFYDELGTTIFLRLYEYTLNNDGRIAQIQYVEDGDYFDRYEIIYDENGNIVTFNHYFDEGEQLIARTTFSYEKSPEPAPNVTGLLSLLNVAFFPEESLYIF